MENKGVKLSVHLTEKDYLKFQTDHLGGRKNKIWWIYGGVIMLILVYVNLNTYLEQGLAGISFTSFVPFLVFGLAIIISVFSIRAKVKSAFKSDVTHQHPMEIILNNEGIIINAYRATTNPLWEEIYRYSITKDTIYIYTAQNKSVIIPKRVFENEADMNQVITLVQTKVDNSKHQKETSKTRNKSWLVFAIMMIVVFLYVFLSGSGNKDLENKARAFETKDDYKSAVAVYTELISENPDTDYYYGERAKCELELSDYKSAIGDCEKAISLQKTGWVYYIYAYALYYDERYADACTAINKSVEMGYAKEQDGLCDPPEN
jgi:uncharacterized membrane protein YhaH (DUF805 family)